MTAKISASIRLEREIFERIQHIATVDRRSISEVIAWAAERGLPSLEAELHTKEAALREEAKPYSVSSSAKKQAA